MRYIYIDNSNFKLIKYQRGHMLYLYTTSLPFATTMLKFSQFGNGNIKACFAQW